jgi:ABC-2 type transport system ATP-binding protein
MNISETTEQTRRFGKREAVHGLTLAVPQGSVLALLGSNGAGKSTTNKTRMNPIEPTSGSARGLGVDLDDVQEAVAAHWKKLGGR